jgi:3-dehydroquinate dehydratase-1
MGIVKRPQLKVKKAVFGSGKYLLCVPLVSSNSEQLVADARQSLEWEPDLFEWRVDYMEAYPEPEPIIEALKQLRAAIGDKPILFTPRHAEEDGARDIEDERKFELIRQVMKTGMVELIDIEKRYGQACLLEWSSQLHAHGTKLVISHHSFKKYLKPDEVLEVLQSEQTWGADIIKIIIKTRNFRDLADFSDALHTARGTFLNVPLIAGVVGKASPLMRVLGDHLGSDMTFVAAGSARSHSSQIHIHEIRRLRDRIR